MDNIANMLTTIRNAQAVKRESAKAPYSKVNLGIAEILKREGLINNFEIKKRGEKSWLILELKYNEDKRPAIADIQMTSKLGKRVYVGYKKVFAVKQGHGLAIVSTPQGIMTGKEARSKKVGGEVLCKVW